MSADLRAVVCLEFKVGPDLRAQETAGPRGAGGWEAGRSREARPARGTRTRRRGPGSSPASDGSARLGRGAGAGRGPAGGRGGGRR